MNGIIRIKKRSLREEMDSIADTVETICSECGLSVKCVGGTIWNLVVRLEIQGDQMTQAAANEICKRMGRCVVFKGDVPSTEIIEVVRRLS